MAEETNKNKDIPMPKYYRNGQRRVLLATPTLHKNRKKLELEPLTAAEAKAFDAKASANTADVIADAEKEAKSIIANAQSEVKTKTAEIKSNAEKEAEDVVAQAKAEAAKIIDEAKKATAKK